MDEQSKKSNQTNNDPLSDAFGIDDGIEILPPSSNLPVSVEGYNNDYVDADYEFARQNVMETVLKAAEALDRAIEVAKVSQAPRAYEVVATLTKVVLDGNKDMLDPADKHKDLKQKEDGPSQKVVNNNLIVTADQLQKLLDKAGVQTDVKKREG